jgi:hypothetical protein
MGGWELLGIEAKCKALFLSRMYHQSTRVGTATAAWLQTWDLTGPHTNPPNATKFPKNLAYVCLFVIGMAYIQPQRKEESTKAFCKRLYHKLHSMAMAAKEPREVRIMLLHPSKDWPKLWHNLHTAPITEEMKSVWFTVIHYIIPTNERLAKIHLTDTMLCKYCGQPDTLQHHITECNEGTDIWRWTRARLAIILRTNPIYISPEWTIRPQFHFFPPPTQRQGAILWVLAHLVYFRIQ